MDSNKNENQNDYNFGFDDDEEDNNQGISHNNNFYQNDNINNNNFNINNFNQNNNNNNNQINYSYNINNYSYNQSDKNHIKNFNQYNNDNNQFKINNDNINNNNQINNTNNNNFNKNNLNNNNFNNNNHQFNNQYNQNRNNQYNNFQNNGNKNNNNKEKKCENPEQEKLRNAYNLFMLGIKDYKGLSLEMALIKFEKVKKTIDEVYPKIEKNKNLKETTDKFLDQVKQYMNATDKRIKSKYNYIEYNYTGKVRNTKEEIARFLKETEMASQQKKKINYFINDQKPKYKDSPSLYSNELKNNINKNNVCNNNNTANKKDDKKIITNDLRDKVLSEIVENKPDVKFSDVVGLKEAKQILREIIIVPNLRPDLFKGLRAPPRGLLLFGPPGTGKTMIAKAVATECKCTFFNISASSLTSKYLGESEKLVRTLFDLAHEMQPSVVFIDEIESILSKRKEDENDAMKRLKTEFLIQFDGVGSGEDLRVLIIGATNRPFDLDPAIIRRLPKRVYVGPFNAQERKGFIKTIITQNKCNITDNEFLKIAEMCNNYSNSDLKELCREAAYEPLRELNVKSLVKVEELRPIVFEDFNRAVKKVRGTLTPKILKELEDWNKEFGALS